MEQETKVKDEASQKEAKKQKNQIRLAKALCIGGLTLAVLGIGTCFKMNDRLVNRTNISLGENYVSVSETRSDGLFGLLGATEYSVFKADGYCNEEVNVFRPFFGQTVFYEDTDFYGVHDGLIDRIFLPDGDEGVSLYRSKNFSGNEDLFREGDQLLKEARERFSVANTAF
jgi:hypothetical protein